jgi:tripartite-type tricarboxylate transporter receptor subunit TctC
MNHFELRRAMLAAAAGAVALPAWTGAAAQGQELAASYPSRPIRWVVPYAPGGATDLIARVIAQHLPEILGQPVIVENRPGAGSALGAEYVARSAPDGYTLLLATIATNAIVPNLQPVRYDPLKDFAPITQIARGPFLVVVNPDLPVRTIADLVALAKARPGGLAYGSGGAGSPQHLSVAMFAAAAGVQLNHVPYRGSGPAITDLISGQIQFMFDNTAMQFVQAGRLRAIASTGETRTPIAPELPTIRESGLPYDFYAWQGLATTGGTPPAVVEKLHAAVIRMLALPEVKAQLGRDGGEVVGTSPQDFATYIQSEHARMKDAVRISGATST